MQSQIARVPGDDLRIFWVLIQCSAHDKSSINTSVKVTDYRTLGLN